MVGEQYYDRDKLYAEIWEQTITKLCEQYGVSHSDLVNVCKELNIPRPPAGYWTQKELGKAPPPVSLPIFNNPPRLLIHPPKKKVKPNKAILSSITKKEAKEEADTLQASQEKTTVKISNWQNLFPKKDCIFPQAFEEASRLIEKEKLPEMAITLPLKKEKEHLYVKNTRKNLEGKLRGLTKNSLSYRNGLFNCYGKCRFNINISQKSFGRVFNILQALCNAFEKRGFVLLSEEWNEYCKQYKTYVMIMGEKISFSITEGHEKDTSGNKNIYSDDNGIPTGILTLENKSRPYYMEYQNKWSDTIESPLEEKLNDIIAGFIFSAVSNKEEAERIKREEKEQKRKEALEKERESLEKQEKQRIVNFKKGTKYWIQHQNMAAFLAIVKKNYRKSNKKNNDTAKWIRWATEYLSKQKTLYEDLIRYNAGEYNEHEKEEIKYNPIYKPQLEEPYNYWKRPWYQRRKN